jgi:hypothetical protein
MDLLRKTLVGITVAGLAIDAFVHLRLAHGYDTVTATISEGALFRIEAVLAVVAAVLLIVRPNRLTAAVAAAVAGGGVAALLLTYYVNAGQLGPLPDMYEPVWFTEKVVTLVAQAVATVTALVLVVIGWPRRASAEPHPVAAQR